MSEPAPPRISSAPSGGRRAFAKSISREGAAEIRSRVAIGAVIQQASDGSDTPVRALDDAVDYEAQLQANARAIAEDPLSDLLLIPDSDVAVSQSKRHLRTTRSTVPANALERSRDLFVRSCLQFYMSEWNMVQRSAQRYQRMSLKPADHEDLPSPVFEIDISRKTGKQRGISLAHELWVREFSTEPAHGGFLSIAKMNAGRKADTISAKAKRRYVLLRFQTEEGPLILEVYKDEKRSSVKDAHDLSGFQSVEHAAHNTGFRIVFEGSLVLLCNAESEAACEEWMEAIRRKIAEMNHLPEEEATGLDEVAFDSRSNENLMEAMLADQDNAHAVATRRRQTARPDIFRVYPGVGDSAGPATSVYESASDPKPFSPAMGTRFSLRCEKLQFRLAVANNSKQQNSEPFFCWISLYDLESRQKLTEDFQFDLNTEEQLSWGSDTKTRVDEITRSRCGVFSVLRPHAEVYAVLTVEKVLQDDVSKIADVYIKGAGNDKAAEKHWRSARSCLARLGQYRMPFAWAARPLFDNGGNLDTTSSWSPLYRQEVDKLKLDDLLKSLGEYHRYISKTNGSSKPPKLTVIPGEFVAEVSAYRPGPPTVTPSLFPVSPYMEKPGQTPRREVFVFPSSGIASPNTEYLNVLYVYPVLVAFANKKVPSGNKARNVACRVELLETDEFPLSKPPTGGKCVYGKSSSARFTTHAVTSVTHHSKSPSFNSEVKVELPVEITRRHHLFFTFYHISVSQTKKPKMLQKIENPIGYAFLPLKDGSQKLVDDEYNLPVAMAGQSYGKGALLPGGYVQQEELGMGAKSGPTIKYIDGGKPLFKVKAKVVSTVYSPDDHLRNFFRECSKHDRTPRANKDLCQRIKALHALTNEALVRTLPVLFNQLLDLLPGSQTANDEVATNVVKYLVHAVDTVHSVDEDKHSPLLRTFITLVFKAPAPTPGTGRTIHGELAKYLGAVMTKIDLDVHMVLKFLRHTWVFFQLIAKSMMQTLPHLPPATSRKARFSAEFNEDLAQLVVRILEALKTTHLREDWTTTQEINSTLGYFLHDCFAVMDRGYVMKLVHTYATMLSQTGITQLQICKFKFLRIITTYEHFVALNLPLRPSSMDTTVAGLDAAYRENHFLAHLLLSELQAMLDSPEITLRRMAIQVLRDLLARHDFDERYADPQRRARIAGVYFPVIHIVLRHSSRLFSASAEPSTEMFDEEDTRDLLMCFLFVLKNINPKTLNYWFTRVGFSSEFFTVLLRCISVFKYVGRQALVAAPRQSAKQVLEGAYTLDLMSPMGKRSGSTSDSPVTMPGQNQRRTSTSSMVPSNWRQKRRDMAKTSSIASVATPNGRTTPPASGRTTPPGLGRRASSGSVASQSVPSSAGGDPPKSGRTRLPSTGGAPVTADEIEKTAQMEGNLATECGFVVLDILDMLLSGFPDVISEHGGANATALASFSLFQALLVNEPSDILINHLFLLLRNFVTKFDHVLFNQSVEFCQTLCLQMLHGCNSRLPALREQSAVLLYTMLRQNLPRLSLDLTIALSKIAGESSKHSDLSLRQSLTKIGRLAKRDKHLPYPSFGFEVPKLMKRLRTVLTDTAQMKRFEHDPEMFIDLQYRVAKSYSNSPELRITWLERMREIHEQHRNWSEAGLCAIHAAAVVAEQLKLKENSPVPTGSKIFEAVSPNVTSESYQPMVDGPSRQSSQTSFGDEAAEANLVTSGMFTIHEMIRFCRKAVSYFRTGKRFELVSRVFSVIMPFWEKERRYEDLAEACGDMQECYLKIMDLNRTQKRHLGTYYRVGFYGIPFQSLNLDGKEYIYKEPDVTKLGEISERLREMYIKQFGPVVQVKLITDSKKVVPDDLDENVAFLQITYVEPHFARGDRETYFERNHNIPEFIFSTPFTSSGKARGSVGEQCMMKTILTVGDEAGEENPRPKAFPYLKKRLLIAGSRNEVLKPLDVAIEEMTKKVEKLESTVASKQTDMTLLQMQLQGSLSAQVNAGPMEYASVFLTYPESHEPEKIETLKRLFADLDHHLGRGLAINQSLIGENQREYHEDMQVKYTKMKQELQKFLGTGTDVPRRKKKEDLNSYLHRISVFGGANSSLRKHTSA